MRRISVGIAVSVSAILWVHQAAARPQPATSVEIESLRAPKVAWREIEWQPCLLDGLRESHEQGKPVLLWIFIDRPADDARC